MITTTEMTMMTTKMTTTTTTKTTTTITTTTITMARPARSREHLGLASERSFLTGSGRIWMACR